MMPRRLRRQAGRHSLVDGIPFTLPVQSEHTPALIAAFAVDARAAGALLPGDEVHPLRLWGNCGVLVITVVDYRMTNIGRYIEFSIAIACTHGARRAPPLIPGLLRRPFDTGQYVFDLPVSTEISVKGGRGIWGMPKHQANLDFAIATDRVWSQYDLDGQLAMRIEVKRPGFERLPFFSSAVNYCQFRGMLMASRIYFRGRAGVHLPFKRDAARLTLGDHPRLAPLHDIGIRERPLFAAFLPETHGVLDDRVQSWFLSFERAPVRTPVGMESVVDLGLSETWLAPPDDPEAAEPGVELATP